MMIWTFSGALAVKAGIAIAKDGEAHSPLCPQGMGLAVVTTDFALEADHPLDPAQSFPVQAPGFEHRNFAEFTCNNKPQPPIHHFFIQAHSVHHRIYGNDL